MSETQDNLTPAEAERILLLGDASLAVVDVVREILAEGYGGGNRRDLESRLGLLSAAAQLLESYMDISPFYIAASASQRRRSIRKRLKHQEDQLGRGVQSNLFDEEISA